MSIRTESTDEKPPISELVRDLRGDKPYHRESSLIPVSGSVTLNLILDGVRDAGRDPLDPGTVDQWYFPEYGVAVIDFGETDEH